MEKYIKVSETPLKEKRIFGILTAKQVGYIPNLQVSFTEDEENFSRDTYSFKSVPVSGLISLNLKDEIYKQNGINEFKKEDLIHDENDHLIEPCTI